MLQENTEEEVCLLDEHNHPFKMLPLLSVSQGMENALHVFFFVAGT